MKPKIKRSVVWSDKAKASLKDIYDYIRKDSIQSAKKVKAEILLASKQLGEHPDQFQLDEFYPNNSGNVRRFFRWSYRIVYEVHDNHIAILLILHTSREPINIKNI